ncbi:PleD family two-component system response regulator [Halioxenophilus sp. WMMB6]|uniref:response regulator n=1 Tax=Halioxenophilus sp. WMMB6 TaxID=3073815 RepID=UPI00295E4B9A|nr:response regulator [Halioxenophilus sp. WMMB6]
MYRILSVDDESTNQKLIQSALGQYYELSFATSGEEALTLFQSVAPDLILLDVHMPGMDGLKVCREVRKLAAAEQLPIIFVSALTTLEDKLKGYEAGANDYIGKPILLPELASKVQLLLQQKQRYTEIESTLNGTRQAMFSAIHYAGELGEVIRFFENSYGANDFAELAKAIFSATDHLNLAVSVQLRSADREENFSSREIIPPLEAELLSLARKGGRIISLNNKSIYNGKGVTILVKNMPLDDSELCGRIRDHLAILLRACEAQLELIETRQQLRAVRNHQIDQLCREVSQQLNGVQELIGQCACELSDGYQEFALNLKEAALLADIDVRQQQALMSALKPLSHAQETSSKQQAAISQIIAGIITSLTTMRD